MPVFGQRGDHHRGDVLGIHEAGGPIAGRQPQFPGADCIGEETLAEVLREPARPADRPLQTALPHSGLAVEDAVKDTAAVLDIVRIIDPAPRCQHDPLYSMPHRPFDERPNELSAVQLHDVDGPHAFQCGIPGAAVGPVEDVLAVAGRRANRQPLRPQSADDTAAGLAGRPGDKNRMFRHDPSQSADVETIHG
nr:hypothetical protein [Nocardia abscessus]